MAKLNLGLPDLRALARGATAQAGDSESFLARRGPTLANVALVMLAAWLGTTWFWYFWPQDQAPAGAAARAPRPTVSAAALGESIAGARLFGQGAQAVTDSGAQAVSTLNVKLKGVFASRGKTPGSAIVNNGQKDEFVPIGTEVLPGVVLDQVFPTHVVLRRGGQFERVNLEERIAAGGGAPLARPGLSNPPRAAPMFVPSTPTPPVPPAAAPSLPPTIPPPGIAGGDKGPPPLPNIPPPNMLPPGVPGVPPGAPQAGTSFDFGRFSVSASGLTIEDVPREGPLARAGLQPGDVVKSVNGQTVNSEADLARLAQLTASGQAVRGEILRDGKTVPIRIRATP